MRLKSTGANMANSTAVVPRRSRSSAGAKDDPEWPVGAVMILVTGI
jgi:hypothetical protein